ncbi:lytic transglycosylase domain-containing protein [Mesorhizobium sp.]|uniref:lytic transglycosylase domain-containing protein n=1 Tax=Mesorhizobium sp. TaxID=1871066 RepID=UPI0025F857D6|nr:lytic transglycosylase domain-containing protein [Mesorhizobium sp.]
MALLLLSGLIFSVASVPAAMAQGSPTVRVASVHPHAAHIAEASRRFGIPAAWIFAMIRAESSGDVHAVSSAGARGLMQVMPRTWAYLRTRYGLGRNPYDPHDNIMAGAAYLREMWDRYRDVNAMLAAYNAGPDRYDEHRATGKKLPPETRAYVAALAPIMLGERPSATASATPRLLDWRKAAIFVARAIGFSADDPAAPERRSTDDRPPVPAASKALAPPQPKGLFVARDAGGDRQ